MPCILVYCCVHDTNSHTHFNNMTIRASITKIIYSKSTVLTFFSLQLKYNGCENELNIFFFNAISKKADKNQNATFKRSKYVIKDIFVFHTP